MRESEIFIDLKNWACEKTSLPFEIADLRFHSAARPPNEIADSLKIVNPKEKPRAFSIYDLRAKPSTISASADVSEQNRETNYTTHTSTQQHTSKLCKCGM